MLLSLHGMQQLAQEQEPKQLPHQSAMQVCGSRQTRLGHGSHSSTRRRLTTQQNACGMRLLWAHADAAPVYQQQARHAQTHRQQARPQDVSGEDPEGPTAQRLQLACKQVVHRLSHCVWREMSEGGGQQEGGGRGGWGEADMQGLPCALLGIDFRPWHTFDPVFRAREFIVPQ